MEHASSDVLIQAINEMIQYHQEERESDVKFAHRLLWFRTFLDRATVIQPEEKQKVEARLNTFDHLLEESSFVRKQRALAWEEGKVVGEARGEEKGQIEVSQQILLRILRDRYPALIPSLQPRIENTKQAEKLLEAIERIINIFDEQKTQDILNTFLA